MQKRFTLIELIICVAIITILTTMVLISLGDARGKARIQCVKDHSIDYCAGQAGIPVQKFKEMLDSDKKSLKDNPSKANE